MVEFAKADFIGKEALLAADKRRRTWGMRVQGGVAHIGKVLSRNGARAGLVCSSAWSPFQQCGVAIVRLDDPDIGPGATLEVACTDGRTRPAVTCGMPMYDQNREFPAASGSTFRKDPMR
jgi:aminomethyltransferase